MIDKIQKALRELKQASNKVSHIGFKLFGDGSGRITVYNTSEIPVATETFNNPREAEAILDSIIEKPMTPAEQWLKTHWHTY